jgi:transcriptional regulator with XRE-family HTH domain
MTTPMPDAEPQTLGQRIKLQRKRLGLSTAAAARRAGVTRDTLAAWEAGTSTPRANRLLTLAGVLETSIGWLLEGKGDCAPAPTAQSDTQALRQQITQAKDLAHSLASMLETLQARLDDLEARDRG